MTFSTWRQTMFVGVVLLFLGADIFANSRPQNTIFFNENWRFHLGDVPDGQRHRISMMPNGEY